MGLCPALDTRTSLLFVNFQSASSKNDERTPFKRVLIGKLIVDRLV